MIRKSVTWIGALIASVVVHALALLALAFATQPKPVPPQAVPQTRLDMATYRVDRSAAQEREARSQVAGEARSEVTALGNVGVPASRASGAELPVEDASALPTRAAPTLTTLPDSETLTVAAPEPTAIVSLSRAGAALDGIAPEVGAAANLTPTADAAATFDAASVVLGASAPNASALAASGLPAEQATSDAPPAEGLEARPASDVATAAVLRNDRTERLASAPAAGPTLAAAAVVARPTLVTAPAASALVARVAEAQVSTAEVPATEAVLVVDAPSAAPALGAVRADAVALIPAAMPAVTQDPAPIPSETAREDPPGARAETPSATTPDGDRARASLAWSGAGEVDPISLAAIQAFMQPGDLARADASVGRVKDSIASILASVPCARLQTTFRPETGALELQGHIPEEDLRGPVLAALQAQVGRAIPVADNILILPRPQCGALSGIAAVGLPQSTDQLTNPRVIGPDTHARVYAFSEGQRLTFDLEGPDYDAVIYIDYYDADGMVLHLQPNQIIGLEEVTAQATLTVGEARTDGPSLNITVAPPFGQEIMVAMAASHPLYNGLRPIREPAETYLQFITDRVTAARERYPDFKGEWVYFFVKTAPR